MTHLEENTLALDWILNSYGDDYFNDGEVLQVTHEKDVISFSLSGAELDPEELPKPFRLGKINNLVGKLCVSGIEYITINGKSVNIIESNHLTTGNITDVKLFKHSLTIEILPEYYESGDRQDTGFTEIIIAMKNVWWENSAHIPIVDTKQPKWPYNPLFDNLSIFHKSKILYVGYRRSDLLFILETLPVRKNSTTRLALTKDRKVHGKLFFRNLKTITDEETNKRIAIRNLNLKDLQLLDPRERCGYFRFAIKRAHTEKELNIFANRYWWENLSHLPLEKVIEYEDKHGF